MQSLPVLHQFMCICMVLRKQKPFRMVEEVSLEPEAPLVWSSFRIPTWRWWTSNAAGWPEHRPAPVGETENANTWHMRGKQDGKHPSNQAPKANHENNGMTIGPSYSTLVLAKWSIAKCSTNSWPLHGQFVLLRMQGWNWPVFEMFRIPGTCLSHHTRITAMHVCDSRFE